ncbi:MAG: hypothetical protein ACK5ME_02320 [Parahaliea sp.]
MNTVSTKVLLLLIFSSLTACTQWQHELGLAIDAQTPSHLQTSMSMAEVLAELGPPLRISASESGYIMAWEYWQIHEQSVGISLGTVGADLLSIDWGDASVSGQFLLVSFDHNHHLSNLSYSTWNKDIGGGQAIQPMVGADLIDIDDLTIPLSQHNWGQDLMESLPKVLNLHNSPGQGTAGIEQRGTPTGTGQRSLEMQ